MRPLLVAMAVVAGACACASSPAEETVDSRGDGGTSPTTTGSGDTTAPPTTSAPVQETGDRATEDGEHTCGGAGELVVAGSGLDVEVTGPCTTVRLEGNGHDVEIARAGTLVVTGNGHEVGIDDADRVEVEGTNHEVEHPASAQVADTSVSSELEPRS